MIFDECHRSQFGDMHKNIVKRFKKWVIFGFTGTPIFTLNAQTKKGIMQTTGQIFAIGEINSAAVAVIVVSPAATKVTFPEASTVATDVSELVDVTSSVIPVIIFLVLV